MDVHVESPPQALRSLQLQTLPEVNEDEADGALLELYGDIARTFGVSQVSSMFRSLGAFPGFLQQTWSALRPNALSPAFDAGANQLRAEALKMVTPFPSYGCDLPLVARLGYLPADIDHLRQGISSFQYLNPQLLLWAAAARVGRERPLGHAESPRQLPEPTQSNPTRIHLMEPDTAPPEVAARYRGLMQLLGVPLVYGDFQFLGSYPTYFYQIYPHLVELIQASGFHDAARSLTGLADRLALSLPYRANLTRPAEGEAEDRIDLFCNLLPRQILLVAQLARRLGCAQEWYAR